MAVSDFVPAPASFGRDKVQFAEIRNPVVRVGPAEDTAVFMYMLDVKSKLADEREPGTDFKRNNE